MRSLAIDFFFLIPRWFAHRPHILSHCGIPYRGDTMKKQQRNRILRLAVRTATLAVVVAVAAGLPINWGQLGKVAALAAAGLRQPTNAATVLSDRLTAAQTPTNQTVTAPSASAPPETAPFPTGGETLPDLTDPEEQPLALPAITMIAPPGEKGNGGKIIEQKMSTGDTRKTGIATLNRSGTSVDIAAALGRELHLQWQDTDSPQVLILHTHTTEGYMQYDGGYYNRGDRNRNQDHTRNVCAAGEAIRLALEQAGISVIHDTTVHDSPMYSGAYTRSAATAEAYLSKYPTIQVVLDIHRDAVVKGETTLVKPTAVVNGRKAAQLMLITGVVSTDSLPNPQWEKNLTFSTHLQRALGEVSPDLVRPLNTVSSRYNQHLGAGCVLVEVGSEGNTVEEAVYAGHLLGQTLAKLLKA